MQKYNGLSWFILNPEHTFIKTIYLRKCLSKIFIVFYSYCNSNYSRQLLECIYEIIDILALPLFSIFIFNSSYANRQANSQPVLQSSRLKTKDKGSEKNFIYSDANKEPLAILLIRAGCKLRDRRRYFTAGAF